MIVVNPPNRNPSPQAAIEAPIWCAYMASYFRDKGFEGVEILDAEAEGLSVDETVNRIGDRSCTLMAMGANPSASSTPKMGVIEELQNKLKIHNTAGLHPQAIGGRNLMILPEPKHLARLTPAWDLIDFSKYRAHNWHCLDGRSRDNYGVIYTSFGCPFNCSYCNIHALYNTRKVTYRDPEDVMDEVTDLVETHHVRNLKVCDELFVLNHSYVNKICDLLIDKGYNLNIWAYARVDTISPPLLEKMKRAGFNWLAYGFESGSDNVLEGVGKKQTMRQMFEAVEMTHEAGINVIGNFIFGLPDDDMRSMYATKQLSKQLRCDWVNYYCAVAYPGSKLYDDTPKELLPDKWEDYDQYSSNFKPLPTKHLTSKEVLEFRDKAFNRFYSNAGYQLRIREKFGEKAVDHIEEMLSWSPR